MEAARIMATVGTTGVDKATRDLSGFDRIIGQVGRGATFALGGLLVAGATAGAAAVAALGASTVGIAADFEKSLSSIEAVSGATAGEMEQISAAALQLGADTAFSAGEAAAGFEELIKGGLSIADAMAAAKPMLDLAAAGEIAVADAAEIAANAIGIFGLEGSDMANVANQIAGAANASSLSVSDFQMSMGAAGSVAAGVGQDFDSLATAIAVMGTAGIKGSDAGTSLKTMLMNLQPTTKDQIAVFKDLGIVMEDGTNQFINANGSFKSMAEIAEILQNSTAGLTDAQRALALETMFGADAIRAANIFVAEGAEGFDAMAASMGKVTAESVAATKLDNFRGAIDAMKGSMETLQIVIGTALLPILTSLVRDHLTPAINSATAFATEFFNAGDKMGFLVTKINELIPGFETLVAWLQVNIPAALATASELWTTTLYPAFVAVGEVLTTTVIPALTSMVTWLTQNWTIVQQVGVAVAVAVAVFQTLSTVAAVIGGVTTAIGGMGTAITTAGSVIGALVVALGGPLTVAIGAVALAAAGLALAWQNNWGDIQGKTQTVVNWWTDTAVPAIQTGVTTLNAASADMNTAWNSDFEMIRGYVNTLKETWNTNVTQIKGYIDNAKQYVADMQAAWNSDFEMIRGFIQSMQDKWNEAVIAIGVAMTTAIGHVTSFRDTVSTKIDEAIGFFSALPGRITGAVGDLSSLLYQAGVDVISGMVSGVTSAVGDLISAVTSAVSSAVEAAKGALDIRSPSKVMKDEVGAPMIDGVIEGMKDRQDKLNAMAKLVVVSALKEASDGTKQPAYDVGYEIGDRYVAGVSDSLKARLRRIKEEFRMLVALGGDFTKELLGPSLKEQINMIKENLQELVDAGEVTREKVVSVMWAMTDQTGEAMRQLIAYLKEAAREAAGIYIKLPGVDLPPPAAPGPPPPNTPGGLEPKPGNQTASSTGATGPYVDKQLNLYVTQPMNVDAEFAGLNAWATAGAV